MVGGKVRQTIKDIGGVLPEHLPAEKHIKEVEKELIECAQNIMKDYEGEFLPTDDEGKCRFCKYKFYCPRWEEK